MKYSLRLIMDRAQGVRALACTFMIGAVFLSACLDNDLPPEQAAHGAQSFIAQQRDFAAFRTWMDFNLGAADTHAGTQGEVIMYVNRLPSSSDKDFPVGTAIVKTVRPKGGELTIHAMAKRGGSYNARGALGWEFFELVINDDDVPVIAWRGAAPPSGEGYQQLPGDKAGGMETDCNDCHLTSENDAVLDDMLDLKALR